ncbi:MAG: histidinol-phosphate transaminase, partial [Thermoguttaceae bacterium]|nr:histidinol-phosphate transaminase [Thermoguttaceae bacterium]
MSMIRENIARMAGYVPGEQPKEGEAVKLNTNENPYRASERVYDAIRAVADRGLSRYPNAVAQPFRVAAAKLYGVEPDWIMCGNGSDDILTILTRAFVGENEILRLPYPSYILYKSLADIQGARGEEVRFTDDWKLPEYFASPLDPAPDSPNRVFPLENLTPDSLKLVYLPNPNSPSGTLLTVEEIEKIADKLPCPLVVDEAYADFAGVNCVELVKRNPRVIVSRTMSKSYALAGLRFGFAVAQPELIYQMIKVKDSYNCDSLSIAAATAAIEDQDWLAETTRKIVATRERQTRKMRELGFRVPDSFANFTWNVHPDPAFSHKELYEYLKKNGYLVRYMNYAGYGDGLRISVGADEQTDACLLPRILLARSCSAFEQKTPVRLCR